MKKTLHGKQHIRSRSNVAVGRQKRFVYKFNRMVIVLNRIDWTDIVRNFAVMAEMAHKASRKIKAIRNLFLVVKQV